MLRVKTPSWPCLPPPTTWMQILFLAPTLVMATYSWPWENRSLSRKMPPAHLPLGEQRHKVQGLRMRAVGLDLLQVPLTWVIFVVVGAYLQSCKSVMHFMQEKQSQDGV